MDLGLNGKRALVLASSRGLGLGIAEALVAEGAHVLLTGRDATRLEEAAARLTEGGPGRADFAVADLAAPDAVAQLQAAATDKLGGVDILVNNTGGPPPGPITETSSEAWVSSFSTMVERVIGITNALLPAMRAQGWGRVLTLTSSGVEQPIPNLGMSNTLRAALLGWSKTTASEVAGDGVTCNVLLPGRIHTARVDDLDAAAAKRQGKSAEEVAAASRASIPTGRYGKVEEFASVAAFLVSEKASYVTGAKVRCDGGMIRSI
ncbi:SDR family oxidoreductase [Salipiger mucosus]|uniref:3-oxoacyl-[acyl-carrier protein] reductase n=1 Tax=Salipiger mucosus DSM 16094 TaxID=1123237 RepID=S9S6N5_9RHOB|nr:SDR family oxidoreductase [Salipiger mucosus]EPX81869.1 3-oxoacyl-[acyl-carrier protein] reductase [Salipiger mucosus DSM 16094]